MPGKEFMDRSWENKLNIVQGEPAATLEERLNKLTAEDQALFHYGSFLLALNSSICGLVANSSFRSVLNITRGRFLTTSFASIVPFFLTSVSYNDIVKNPLLAGDIHNEITAVTRGFITGAIPGYLYPIIVAFPLNVVFAVRYSASPMPSKRNAFNYWLELTKPAFKKTRYAHFIQIALGIYLSLKHHKIYCKMTQMPEPERKPEELRE